MHPREAASDAYILKSELAMRRHAVLVPLEVPAAKRQKTGGPDEPCACARAHSFVSNSPLSPSKQKGHNAAAVPTSPCEIIEDPPDSADTSSEEEANFAVKTDSELEAAYRNPRSASVQSPDEVDIDLPAVAVAEPPGTSTVDTEAEQNNVRCQASEAHAVPTEPKSPSPQTGSLQESTGGVGSSVPSGISHETIVAAAVPKEDVDSPTSPPTLPIEPPSDHHAAGSTLHVQDSAKDLTAGPSTVILNQQPAANVSEATSVAQLLSSGSYQLDAGHQQVVACNLKTYKAKVDEVHAGGKVSLPNNTHIVIL